MLSTIYGGFGEGCWVTLPSILVNLAHAKRHRATSRRLSFEPSRMAVTRNYRLKLACLMSFGRPPRLESFSGALRDRPRVLAVAKFFNM